MMQQPVLEYGREPRGGTVVHLARLALAAANFVFRTGSRAGAIAQVCAWFAWISLPRSPANVAHVFWRQEALAATAFSLLWLASAGNGKRRQPAMFLTANGLGCAFAQLLPILNS